MRAVFCAIKARDVDRVRCFSQQDIRNSSEPDDSPAKATPLLAKSGSRHHHMPKEGIVVAVVYIKSVKLSCFEKQ